MNGERQAPDPGPAVAARFGAKGAELEGGPARGAVAVLVHPVAQHAGGLGTQQEFDQPAAQFVALTGAAEQAGEDAPVVGNQDPDLVLPGPQAQHTLFRLLRCRMFFTALPNRDIEPEDAPFSDLACHGHGSAHELCKAPAQGQAKPSSTALEP